MLEKIPPLSVNKCRLVILLNEAHRHGEIELPLAAIADKLSLEKSEIKQNITELVDLGLVDKSETDDGASLSAAGLKIASLLLQKGINSFSQLQENNEFNISKSISQIGWDQIQRLVNNWPEVVNSSSLSKSEKKKLLKLGEQLFQHPATIELLRRALIVTA